MTDNEWQKLEALIATMTDAERLRLTTLLAGPSKPTTSAETDSVIGLFADEPELIDEIIKGVYLARETHPLRTPIDGP